VELRRPPGCDPGALPAELQRQRCRKLERVPRATWWRNTTRPDVARSAVRPRVAPPGLEPGLSWSLTTSAFAAAQSLERWWSGLCLHLRQYAVRWLPPSLYTFPSRGLARRCQSRVRRLREHSRAPFPAWCPASAPWGAA